MSSRDHGTRISESEVTDIISTGFWIMARDREFFVPFSDYPVFQRATIEQIFAMEELTPGQFHWPELDADVELEALEHPENYPLS